MFEIEPSRLREFVKKISLAKTTKPLLDPLKFVFEKDHALVRQVDSTETLAVVAKFDSSFFRNHEEGIVTIPVSDVLKRLKDLFQGIDTVKVSIDEKNGKLVFTSSTESWRIPAPEPSMVKDLPEYKETEVGFLLPKMEIGSAFLIRCDSMKTIGGSKIGFEWSDKKLVVFVKDDQTGEEYTKEISFVKKQGGGEGRVLVDGDILERIIKLYKTEPVWLILNTDIPVVISSIGENYKISYIMSPISE